MENGHQVGLGILKFKIIFILMFTNMKFFDFVIIIFKNHMFKVGLYILTKIKQMSQLAKYTQISAQID
jgi:hypothetical protein